MDSLNAPLPHSATPATPATLATPATPATPAGTSNTSNTRNTAFFCRLHHWSADLPASECNSGCNSWPYLRRLARQNPSMPRLPHQAAHVRLVKLLESSNQDSSSQRSNRRSAGCGRCSLTPGALRALQVRYDIINQAAGQARPARRGRWRSARPTPPDRLARCRRAAARHCVRRPRSAEARPSLTFDLEKGAPEARCAC